MSNTYKEHGLDVITSWNSGQSNEQYRLVNVAFGPAHLEELNDDVWSQVSAHYEFGLLVERVKYLTKNQK